MADNDTTLGSDTLDQEYGGRPAKDFGGPVWRWLHSVVRFLSRAYLTYLRVAYGTIVATSQTSAVAGDVAVFVAGNVVASGGYDVRKYIAGLTTPIIVGIYLEPVSATAKARIASHGIIPQTITGLGASTVAAIAGLDAAAGRVRVAVVGDVALGTIDRQGNLHFTGAGSTAP